jgi:hypothetical protein
MEGSAEALSFKREKLILLMKQNSIMQVRDEPVSTRDCSRDRSSKECHMAANIVPLHRDKAESHFDTLSGNLELRELLLQDNLLNQAQFAEHCSGAEDSGTSVTSVLLNSKCSLSFTGPHLGIPFPLGYTLSDYGVQAWELH